MRTELFPYFVGGGRQETAMSVKCRYATYTLDVKFPTILIHKALYLPYRWCSCQNPVSSYSTLKNITPAFAPKSRIIREIAQLYDCQRNVTVTQLAVNRYFKQSTTYQHPSGMRNRA